jgi:hypothetical protein
MMKALRFAYFLLLSSCLGGVSFAGNASTAIEALTVQKKAELFKALIISAGESCSEVSRVVFKGENRSDDSAYYAVRCSIKSDWVVSIKNSGGMSSRVTSCATLKLLGLACWDPI